MKDSTTPGHSVATRPDATAAMESGATVATGLGATVAMALDVPHYCIVAGDKRGSIHTYRAKLIPMPLNIGMEVEVT